MPRSSQKPSKRDREWALARLAARQHGAVARYQLRELGFGQDAVETRLAQGRLQRLHDEVYAAGHNHIDRRGRWWAAVLAYGPDAVLSHGTAAAAWGFQRSSRGPVHVNAPRGRQGLRRRSGIWIHRCKLDAEDRAVVDGIPVTTVARTLFDLAEVVPLERLEHAAEEADRLKQLRRVELEAVCARSPGRRALRPIRLVLTQLRPPDEGRSPLETRFSAFVRAHRLPPPAQNVHILGHEVDALWAEAKLIVELDGWEYHGHRAAFERDRTRDARLLIAGYRTIRVTHRRLDREADQLAAEIRQLLTI